MKDKRRDVEIVVISDCHLGTYGSRASELYHYLKSVKPDTLILNGDIIDFWQFSKHYWPKYHMKTVKEIISLAAKGTRVFYITGNHDETLRKFAGLSVGNIRIVNKLELILDGKNTWFFHGDVFDVFMKHSRWLEKTGAIGYDSLILVNVFLNYLCKLVGRKKISLSAKIKDNVKTAVKYIGNFEHTAAMLARKRDFQAIVCGHIHYPEIKEIDLAENGSITYMNSGDWIENNSALEYNAGTWQLYRHPAETGKTEAQAADDNELLMDMNNKEIFKIVMKEFQL
jgi:UDP-2,3-diacylglucosamine pyrophosphatase LpxH